MLKKIAITAIVVVVIIIAGLYFYRHAIIRYYTERIVRENLPGYIKIDKVDFDFTRSKVSFKNFRILNAPGFPSQFFIKVDDISCRYGIIGKGVPTGLEISDVSLTGADLRIERLNDGRVNAAEMEKFVKSFPSGKTADRGPGIGSSKKTDVSVNNNISNMIKLPTSFDIRNAKLVFLDNVPYENPYIITIESVSGKVLMEFGDNYTKVASLSFALSGRLNGEKNESIKWTSSLNPNTPRLTMSNRFEVSGLNLTTLAPYYDSFSPLVFKRGAFSGTMVFDFNNGNIGSTNEVYLSDLAFYVKKGYENAQIWGTTVPDLMRYFTTTSGDIVFDFKLKGDMSKPEFYLGPISKRALTSMVVDKIASYAIKQGTKQGSGGNVGNAEEAINMFKQFLKK